VRSISEKIDLLFPYHNLDEQKIGEEKQEQKVGEH
jgi:hypothetical protein